MAEAETESKSESKGHALINHQPAETSRGGWHAAIFIIFVEVAERFAYQGIASNLIIYLSDVLNEPMSTAVQNVNTWTGVSALFPILGGFIADSYLGRFKTILLSSVIYLMGMIFLTFSVSIMKHKTLFFLALYVLSIGDGGHRPCVQTFAADQFDEDTPEERHAKSSFFNWWYLGIVFGSVTSVFVVVYLQDKIGWGVGFGVMAGVLAFALVMFLLGVKRYRKEGPTGSPITKVAQVFVAAARKCHVKPRHHPCHWGGDEVGGSHLPCQPSQPKSHTLIHTNQFRFLDKATIMDDLDISSKTRNPWRLCSITQVEEVKLVLRLIPIWLSCLMFNVVQTQTHTFFVKQGKTLVRTIGTFEILPASLLGFIGLIIIPAVLLYDRVFVPTARKLTGHPTGITVLQRIGVGIFLSILNMVVSALVEAKRVGVARDHNLLDNPNAVLPMRIWWLLPQYMITGISDAFTIVGLQELFYDQMPESLRSLGAAAYICITGIGGFVSNAIIAIVEAVTSKTGENWLGNNINRAHLDYFYWVLAVLSALDLCVYVWLARAFVYKQVDEVDEATSQHGSDLNKYHNQVP